MFYGPQVFRFYLWQPRIVFNTMHKFFLPYNKVQFIDTVVIKNTSGPCIRSRPIIYFSVHTYEPHYLGLINCWNWSYFYYNLIFLSSWCDRCCCVQLTAAETVFQIITLACLWNDRPVLSLKMPSRILLILHDLTIVSKLFFDFYWQNFALFISFEYFENKCYI